MAEKDVWLDDGFWASKDGPTRLLRHHTAVDDPEAWLYRGFHTGDVERRDPLSERVIEGASVHFAEENGPIFTPGAAGWLGAVMGRVPLAAIPPITAKYPPIACQDPPGSDAWFGVVARRSPLEPAIGFAIGSTFAAVPELGFFDFMWVTPEPEAPPDVSSADLRTLKAGLVSLLFGELARHSHVGVLARVARESLRNRLTVNAFRPLGEVLSERVVGVTL